MIDSVTGEVADASTERASTISGRSSRNEYIRR